MITDADLEGMITYNQKRVLTTLSKEGKINLVQLILHVLDKFESLDNLTYDEGVRLITEVGILLK